MIRTSKGRKIVGAKNIQGALFVYYYDTLCNFTFTNFERRD